MRWAEIGTFLYGFRFLFLAFSLRWIDGSLFGHGELKSLMGVSRTMSKNS